MSVLDEIVAGVREDLNARREPLAALAERVEQAPPVRDPRAALSSEELAIIAEVKRSSPSKGALADIANPAALAAQYEEGGANVVSVLTERRRFNGSLEDLHAVRQAIEIPVLRKDFMVDEYQFYEARAYGADLILLIVAALSKNQLKDFHDLTRELGMKALVEVHTHHELESAMEINPEIVGVNSRNLKTLEVDTSVFINLIPEIPGSVIAVAESGISSVDDVAIARKAGARAILVGEALVRSGDPARAIREFRSPR